MPVCTDDPNQVVGCTDCLELAAEDPRGGQQPLRHPLPALPGDDQRRRQCGLAQSGPSARPSLRKGRVVTNGPTQTPGLRD